MILSNGVCRISAEVDGEQIWFETADVELARSAEAFASVLLIPSLDQGEVLFLSDPLSPLWRSNVRQSMATFNKWWDYPQLVPVSDAVTEPALKISRSTRTALCFTGGVDSFYTLLRSGYKVDFLVFVLGYDMRKDDAVRFTAFTETLRAVAKHVGAHPIVVQTNLREHSKFSPVSWERTHGGALAAMGHLLRDVAGQLLISSTFPHELLKPWGSHWSTDGFCSSESSQIIHTNAENYRNIKLREMVDEPLVRQHLRVCWENRSVSGNCSKCEKCVRTRLLLSQCGKPSSFPVFEDEKTLLADLKSIPDVTPVLLAYREMQGKPGLSPELNHELNTLVAGKGMRSWRGRATAVTRRLRAKG